MSRRRSRPGVLRILPALPLLALTAADPAGAQEIEFTPRADRAAERRLDRFLEAGGYALWTRDTVLAAPDTVRGDVLVLEAAVRIAGRIEGNVFVVDGDLFLRPGASLEGDAVVLGGGFYGSRLADVRGVVEWRPTDGYLVVPTPDGYAIYPAEDPARPVELHGLYGLHLPTVQRVDGWTFGWGATLRATGLAWQPSLEVVGRYLTEPGSLEGTARQLWYPTGLWQFGVEAERATRTHDAWMRGDALNSLSFLFVGEDFRNYWRADRVAFVAARRRQAQWTPSLAVAWEDASSLRARRQTVLLDSDDVRPNPPIDEGEIVSAAFALGIERRTARTRLAARASVEGADSSVAGNFSFLLAELRVAWEGPAFAGHSFELFGIGRGDVAGTLPRQRWSALGGRMTLPTFAVLGARGPRLAFVRATYLVPVLPLRLGPLGTPRVFGRVSLGSVWAQGASPRFEQNVGAGVRILAGEVEGVWDPDGGGGLLVARVRIPGAP